MAVLGGIVDKLAGWTGLVNKPAAEDSNTAHSLRQLGAILYVKTNVPQSLMVINGVLL